MRLLVVDDQVLFRQGLVNLINSKPEFEVVGEASTVHQAIEVARQLQPDLVLMDFNLPDGTGLEATQAILHESPECKIVFLTIYETDDKLLDAIRLGAKGYMLKNVPISQLLNSLKAVERGEPAISRRMTGRIIEAFSHMDSPRIEKSEAVNRLSRRELEIMGELAEGFSNREIADRLVISENTVKHHVHNILGKLELSDRHEASEFARKNGIRRRTSGFDSYA